MADPAKLIVVMAYDADPETGLPFAALEPIQCTSSEKAISLARGLATIWIDGENVNAWLVNNGFAVSRDCRG